MCNSAREDPVDLEGRRPERLAREDLVDSRGYSDEQYDVTRLESPKNQRR
jgi:hypothetical protein